ncbi:HIT domain-containing protein [bacterium]|nr:HIT domain-containing protein [bacterium]MBT5015087.1 HIT domain-containing protein [bacterium]
MEECIFCKVVSGDISSKSVMDTDNVLVLKDIAPKAPIHYLIIPKKHLQDLRSFEDIDSNLAGELLLTAQKLSELNDGIPFRILINNGHEVGQRVNHVHLHFLAGKELPELF